MRAVDPKTHKWIFDDEAKISRVGQRLTTPRGTRIFLREYGSRLIDFIDRPENQAIDVAAEAANALREETGIKVERIIPVREGEGKLSLRIILRDGSEMRVDL